MTTLFRTAVIFLVIILPSSAVEARKPLVWDTSNNGSHDRDDRDDESERGEIEKREGTPMAGMVLISFLAGVLSFLSPCTLPILPAYFAFTFQSDNRRIFLMTMAFFAGLATSFSLMGGAATLMGSMITSGMPILIKAGGFVIILLGLLSLLGKGFGGVQFQDRPGASFAGSFIYGASFSVGWSACIGPILAAILVMAATQEKVLSGMLLLYIYAIGLGLPLVILSLVFKRLDRDGGFWRLIRGRGWDLKFAGHNIHIHSNNLVSGLIFITLGILMMGDYLSVINRIIPPAAQIWYGRLEEGLMGLLQ